MAELHDEAYTQPLRHALREKLANDMIAADREEFTIASTASLEELLKQLREHKVHSVPVLDGARENCLGFVDYRDLVGFVCQVVPDFEKDEATRRTFEQLLHAGTTDRALHMHKVDAVIDFSGRDPYVPLYAGSTSLLQVAEFLGKGLYRVALFKGEGGDDDASTQLATISQSDVARFLHDVGFRGNGKELGSKTIAQLGYGSSKVATIEDSATLSSALRKLHALGYSGFAVVDDQGKLVGNFSASDLQGVYQETIPDFTQSVRQFLEKHAPHSLTAATIDPASHTLEEVVRMFVDSGLKHFWAKDADGKPSGVFTLTDLCNLAVNATLEKPQ